MVQSRSEDTRERVLDAAAALIIDRGIADVTLKDIQEQSGVSNGSIFHHFGSKDGIVIQLFVRERRAYWSSVAAAILEFEGDDPCDAFAAGARASLEWHCAHPERFSRLVAAFTDSDWMREHADLWLEFASEIERPLVEWATPHFQSGRLPIIPTALFQAIMMGGTERLTNAWMVGRLDRPSLDYADELQLVVSAGLKAIRDKQRAKP